MKVFFPVGFLSKREDVSVEEISHQDGERMIQDEGGVLPPGTGYASSYFMLSPQSKLGCDSNPAQCFMRLSRSYGVSVYHSSEALGYKTWHKVDAKMSIMHAAFNTPHGKDWSRGPG